MSRSSLAWLNALVCLFLAVTVNGGGVSLRIAIYNSLAILNIHSCLFHVATTQLLRGVPPIDEIDEDQPTLRHIPPTPKSETAVFVNPSVRART